MPSLVCAFADQITAAGIDVNAYLARFLPTNVVGFIGATTAILIVVCRVYTTTTIFRRD